MQTCAPSEDSDQTAHSRSLIRIFPERILGCQGCKVSTCIKRRLWSECADAQTDLRLRSAIMSESACSQIDIHTHVWNELYVIICDSKHHVIQFHSKSNRLKKRRYKLFSYHLFIEKRHKLPCTIIKGVCHKCVNLAWSMAFTTSLVFTNKTDSQNQVWNWF